MTKRKLSLKNLAGSDLLLFGVVFTTLNPHGGEYHIVKQIFDKFEILDIFGETTGATFVSGVRVRRSSSSENSNNDLNDKTRIFDEDVSYGSENLAAISAPKQQRQDFAHAGFNHSMAEVIFTSTSLTTEPPLEASSTLGMGVSYLELGAEGVTAEQAALDNFKKVREELDHKAKIHARLRRIVGSAPQAIFVETTKPVAAPVVDPVAGFPAVKKFYHQFSHGAFHKKMEVADVAEIQANEKHFYHFLQGEHSGEKMWHWQLRAGDDERDELYWTDVGRDREHSEKYHIEEYKEGTEMRAREYNRAAVIEIKKFLGIQRKMQGHQDNRPLNVLPESWTFADASKNMGFGPSWIYANQQFVEPEVIHPEKPLKKVRVSSAAIQNSEENKDFVDLPNVKFLDTLVLSSATYARTQLFHVGVGILETSGTSGTFDKVDIHLAPAKPAHPAKHPETSLPPPGRN